ncbi:MAG: diphosphomevalonate/mevalonate 3,5-bisphosphate decarboxylase family protein [Silvanigrellaceae bacterium]
MNPTLFDENPHLELFAERLLRARENGTLLLQGGDAGYCSAPSNIALLKYWGKRAGCRQIPANSSISMTLGGFRAFTEVSVVGRFFPLKQGRPDEPFSRPAFSLELNGIEQPMPAKMEQFLRNILAVYAPDIALRVKTFNNFPLACGVASSAAGYAALVGAVADVLNLRRFLDCAELTLWMSEWSRLGSGSATRSALAPGFGPGAVNNQFVAWNLLHDKFLDSAASPLTQTQVCQHDSRLNDLRHCVLVVDGKEKQTGSSEGHELAQTSVLQNIRLAQYPLRFERMWTAIADGDVQTIAELSEIDAFEMHSVMGTGAVPLKYMNNVTATAIRRCIELRDRQSERIFWTLDAGPNPHFVFERTASQGLARLFEHLSKDEAFSSARVLIGKDSNPNGILVGTEELSRHGFFPFAPPFEDILIKCTLQQAAEFLRS